MAWICVYSRITDCKNWCLNPELQITARIGVLSRIAMQTVRINVSQITARIDVSLRGRI